MSFTDNITFTSNIGFNGYKPAKYNTPAVATNPIDLPYVPVTQPPMIAPVAMDLGSMLPSMESLWQEHMAVMARQNPEYENGEITLINENGQTVKVKAKPIFSRIQGTILHSYYERPDYEYDVSKGSLPQQGNGNYIVRRFRVERDVFLRDAALLTQQMFINGYLTVIYEVEQGEAESLGITFNEAKVMGHEARWGTEHSSENPVYFVFGGEAEKTRDYAISELLTSITVEYGFGLMKVSHVDQEYQHKTYDPDNGCKYTILRTGYNYSEEVVMFRGYDFKLWQDPTMGQKIKKPKNNEEYIAWTQQPGLQGERRNKNGKWEYFVDLSRNGPFYTSLNGRQQMFQVARFRTPDKREPAVEVVPTDRSAELKLDVMSPIL